MNTKHLLPSVLAVVFLAALIMSAEAASPASATTDLNLRAGPSTSYPVVTVVPQSASVQMYGCNADTTWCDIAYGQYRGWASANYLAISQAGQPVAVTPAVVATVGIATTAYSRAYWDTYYETYPWYGQWNVYYAPPAANGGNGGVAGCAGNSCAGTQKATGAQGGTARRSGACVNGTCGGRKTVTTPGGNTASKTVTCSRGDPNCNVTGTGPRGNTATRQRGWRR